MKTLFGTDGIRAYINDPILTPENFTRLGRILGAIIRDKPPVSGKRLVSIGRDTRASGQYLESGLVAGLTSMGIDCELLGIMPTSAIAYCSQLSQSSFGLVISASHNPSHDNGIKIFGSNGFKLDENTEHEIEMRFGNYIGDISLNPGKVSFNHNANDDYLELLKKVHKPSLLARKLRLVVDCAHGAASRIAIHLFSYLGYEARIIGASPDGHNINRGFGSESPGKLKSQVLNNKADLGIAFDGDADRVIFINEKGELIDGDALLATFAVHLKKQGRLAKNTLVSTVMSSIALDHALEPYDIKVERSHVGDKWVSKALVDGGFSFGGENSGHLIMLPETSTGDGLFSALQFLNIINESTLPVSELTGFYKPTPKILKNFAVTKKTPLNQLPYTQTAIDLANQKLQQYGRVMFRYSGTENKARLLVEASSQAECHSIADSIMREFEKDQI